MQFASVDDLREKLIRGQITNIPQELSIGDTQYKRISIDPTLDLRFSELVGEKKDKRPLILYSIKDRNTTAKEKAIALVWHVTPGLRIIPSAVVPIENIRRQLQIHQGKEHLIHTEAEEKGANNNAIGLTAQVTFIGLSDKPLLARVDTGASMSSLHADEWQVDENTKRVLFTNKELSDKNITMPLDTHVPVKTPDGKDGGVEYRPVVSFNIKIGDKILKNVLFNLNKRAHMGQPVLLGANALQQGKFVVDPTMESEENEIDWGYIAEQIEEYIKQQPVNEEQEKPSAQAIYEIMLNSDISFSDLMRYIKTEVTKT